ncbi:EamA family transporter [Streptomyces sioyaensis]|uniref:EamA family transporter n=1 Tax=Streptomyces sioyaensis TaxID=67364 RepID=UPI0037D0A38E
MALRLTLAAVLLVALWRPGWRWDRRTWNLPLGAGTLIAVHHLSYYGAVERVPLGAATTMEFIGPFALALAGSRRPADLLWAALAATGVVLLSRSGVPMNGAGLLFGLLAGGCWSGYILVGKRLAAHLPDGRGLALAVSWGALLSLPYGILQAGTRLLDPGTLSIAAAVAVLSSVLPLLLPDGGTAPPAVRRLRGAHQPRTRGGGNHRAVVPRPAPRPAAMDWSGGGGAGLGRGTRAA